MSLVNSILRNYLGQFMRLTLSRVGEQKPSRVYKNPRVQSQMNFNKIKSVTSLRYFHGTHNQRKSYEVLFILKTA